MANIRGIVQHCPRFIHILLETRFLHGDFVVPPPISCFFARYYIRTPQIIQQSCRVPMWCGSPGPVTNLWLVIS
jgi:hypothetical protein